MFIFCVWLYVAIDVIAYSNGLTPMRHRRHMSWDVKQLQLFWAIDFSLLLRWRLGSEANPGGSRIFEAFLAVLRDWLKKSWDKIFYLKLMVIANELALSG